MLSYMSLPAPAVWTYLLMNLKHLRVAGNILKIMQTSGGEGKSSDKEKAKVLQLTQGKIHKEQNLKYGEQQANVYKEI